MTWECNAVETKKNGCAASSIVKLEMTSECAKDNYDCLPSENNKNALPTVDSSEKCCVKHEVVVDTAAEIDGKSESETREESTYRSCEVEVNKQSSTTK